MSYRDEVLLIDVFHGDYAAHNCLRKAAEIAARADARIAELEAEVAVLRVDANLHKQIHRAAKLLPDRCEIQLTVENGSGWVELFTGHAWVEPSPDGDLAEQVSECIDRALEDES